MSSDIINLQKHVSKANAEYKRFYRELAPCSESFEYKVPKYKRDPNKGKAYMLLFIEFLTTYSRKGDTVLYLGVRDSKYVNYLASMFKDINFVVFDPKTEVVIHKHITNLKYKKSYFSIPEAYKYSDIKDILMISTIRSSRGNSFCNKEMADIMDMEQQKSYYKIVNPRKSILNFKLPLKIYRRNRTGKNKKWVNGKNYFNYMEGKIITIPCISHSSKWSALVLDMDAKIKKYWNSAHENKLNYHNHMRKNNLFRHRVKSQILDHCYDCVAQVHILRKYVLKYVDYTFTCGMVDIDKRAFNLIKSINDL